jgi:predicted esterase
MNEHHIQVKRTARYYTLGELNSSTKNFWLVIHGFGQNAKDFIANFNGLLDDETFIVAPEALNRFYLKGSGGAVGATWMTKEDRLNEIADYCNYIEELIATFNLGSYRNLKFYALGFSQGGSTITRWADKTKHNVNNLVVYAGEVGAELLPLSAESKLSGTKNFFVYGNRDEFFPPEIFETMKKKYAEMNFEHVPFDGTHEINLDTVRRCI